MVKDALQKMQGFFFVCASFSLFDRYLLQNAATSRLQRKENIFMADNRCIYCDRKITPKNSPSQFDVYGNWTDSNRYPVICDECMDRLSNK